jgi:NitT/TauT family transport system ATP-binding protein
MPTHSLIELHHLTHTYVTKSEAKTAIEDIHLSVAEGAFISLVGPSGCGKSTILSCIAGLIRPTSGEVRIKGKKINGPSPQVGYMLQSDYLFEWQTIQENVLVGLRVMGKFSTESKKHANYLLHEMGLSEYKDHYPSQLSGGMRQRAALVRTLVTNPDILLLDEPFSALDYQTRLKLEDLVFETLKKHEKTAILVTHDIGESIAMSDKIIVLDNDPGKFKQEVQIPEHIRHSLPFHARDKEGYLELFHKIWKELDQNES